MAKYNYDKKVLKGLGVGAFLNEVKLREKYIAEGSTELPNPDYNVNILATKLHPNFQFAAVSEIKELSKDAKLITIKPNEAMGGKSLAYFRAGQYIEIVFNIGEATPNRPYTLCSDPKKALGESGNTYQIMVKRAKEGLVSNYILDNWNEGTPLFISGPLGNFTYERLRDAKNVVALAGGSGITPFYAMAQAIVSGIEDFNLTILYGSRKADSILLKDELEALEKASGGKVKVVNILMNEVAEGYENGVITADLIKKYAPKEDYSIFVCGPKAMYKQLEGEIAKLSLPRRRVRYEVSGEYGDPTGDAAYPKEAAGKEYKVHVISKGDTWDLTCRSDESLVHAMEMAGVRVPTDCRSGECGWCHSRLISGKVYIPESNDGRRAADKKFGWIHPCVSYPLSDIEIEIFQLG